MDLSKQFNFSPIALNKEFHQFIDGGWYGLGPSPKAYSEPKKEIKRGAKPAPLTA